MLPIGAIQIILFSKFDPLLELCFYNNEIPVFYAEQEKNGLYSEQGLGQVLTWMSLTYFSRSGAVIGHVHDWS